jgi:RHS repeat-associated protein
LHQRTVSFDGTTPALQQTFSYATSWSSSSSTTWQTKTTTVTNDDLLAGQTYTTVYTYSPVTLPIPPKASSAFAVQMPLEQSIVYKNSSGTPLMMTTESWNDPYTLASKSTALYNTAGTASTTSQTKFSYGSRDQLTEQDDYDFGNTTTPIRKTLWTYQVFPTVPTYPALPTIVDRPCKMQIEDGNSNPFAETDYLYDGQSSPCTTAVTQTTGSVSVPAVTHDELNYGATKTPARGNVTSLIRKCLQSCSDAKTTYVYDETGQISSETDPCGNVTCSGMVGSNHTTSYLYTDRPTNGNAGGNSNAYITQIIEPNTGVAHAELYWYNYPSGQLSESQDQNQLLTYYSYNDPLNRLKLVDNAPGSQNWVDGSSAESKTAYNYVGETEIDLNQDQASTGDGLLASKTFLDGMLHTTKTIARDGSFIETAYNGMGWVCAVSNPTVNDPGPLTCAIGSNKSSSPTDGYTYFTYDALGRKTVQTQQDNTTQTWTPSENVVDFVDETGSHWQWTKDALGRLTKTLENDPGGSKVLTLETDYTFNPLGDLLSVNQLGGNISGVSTRYRTFMYDSLSRLTNACNPESITVGSTCTPTSGPWSGVYTYDANSNVITRTDARGIITDYAHDALNRLTGKTYPNDTLGNTPAVSYGYDVEYPWQVLQYENHPVGHLNSIMSTLGSINLLTWTSVDYDQRGNLTGSTTCVNSNAQGCPGSGVGLGLWYDLDDKLNGIVENASSPTFSYQYDTISLGYDSSGRLNSIQTYISLDNSGSNLTSTAFSGLTYYPGGAVKTANLAIDPTSMVPGIVLSRTFNNRQRVTGEADANSKSSSAYSYTVGYDGAGNVSSFNDSVAGSGTVLNDALHRFSSFTGTVNGKSASFQETYDNFGNRQNEYYTYNGVQNQPSPYFHFKAGNNHADELSGNYDAAGNLKNDGTNMYLYDAENRLCAEQSVTPGGKMTGYVYSPDGTRFGKGTITGTFTCDLTKNGLLQSNVLSLTSVYVVGPQGEQLEETDGNFNVRHFNVFWESKLLGTFTGTTYSQSNWHFALNDWLGTKRQVTNSDGTASTSFSSGPFGDFPTQYGGGSDPSEQHFTPKELDSESGLNYFGARYYEPDMGRFLSPDWSKNPQGVPYADFTNPQTLNLYSYVKNNPLSLTDPDGHCWSGFQWACNVGQSFGNLFSGVGFHTDQTVENNLQNANQYLRQHGVSTEGMRDAAILKTFQTYTKNNPDTGQTYSGRTSGTRSPEENVILRDRSHHMNEEGYGPANLDKSSTNPAAIRGREQQLIDANGGAQSQGGTSGNAINGVSPTNPNKPVYCSACESEFPVEPVGPVEPIEPIEIPF